MGLNRLILGSNEVNNGIGRIKKGDERLEIIRKWGEEIRVGIEDGGVCDDARVEWDEEGVRIWIKEGEKRKRENVVVIVAMQRPKVMARVLETCAGMGVQGVIITAAAKVEKSYWDCKLLRQSEKGDTLLPEKSLPGRPRGEGKHPERNQVESVGSMTRVDEAEEVRRRLLEGVQQGAYDVSVPWVVVERRGIEAVLSDGEYGCGKREGWKKILMHPGESGKWEGGEGVVVAIGPEGGWTEEEVQVWRGGGFECCAVGKRVMRSEVAVAVGIGLAVNALGG